MQVDQIDTQNKRALCRFIEFPRKLYDGNSSWVQPLTREIERKLNPTLSPFCRYGSITLYVAFNENHQMCGRIAAITNPWHERLHKELAGFFGMFECINDLSVARELLNVASHHFKETGCKSLIGPVNLTTNDEFGILVEGYDRPPTFMCNYSLPYYLSLMEQCGLTKLIDTLAYEAILGHPFPEKYYRVVTRVSENNRISLRRFSRPTAMSDIQVIRELYNESFKTIWGFVPLSEEEAEVLGQGLLQFADPDLVWLAFYDNRPVGFILGFPDLNEILRHAKGRLGPMSILRILFRRWSLHGMRVAAFGVLPDFRALGIEAALIWRVHNRINRRPYQRVEFSVVMENNHRMRRLLESIGFAKTKRYRLFQKEL